MNNYAEESLALHKEKRGKVEIHSKVPVETRADLSRAYTPGVAAPCLEIARDKELAYEYTSKGNMIAVVTDGSAVLGLGNIGPEAALPVMEGKAILFKEFAGVDAVPICLATQNVDEIVETVRRIAPGFGGINLEDISAPRCFEIEERLQDLGIPVFHDDQHGTAIVVLAALLNASRVVGKSMRSLRVVLSGAGAAGTAITQLLQCMGKEHGMCISVADVVVCDSKGIIHEGRTDLNEEKRRIAASTNQDNRSGSLADAMVGADVFIGVSAAGLVTQEMVKSMAPQAIVFAMANPTPEIMPDQARAAGAAVVASGRSDFPNQVNNVLAFPGIFKGALAMRAPRITTEMQLITAETLAKLVEHPTADAILPDPLNKNIATAIADAIVKQCSN